MKFRHKVLINLSYILAALIFFLVAWSNKNLGIRLYEIIFTLKGPLQGADHSLIINMTKSILPFMMIFLIIYILIYHYIFYKLQERLIDKIIFKFHFKFYLKKFVNKCFVYGSIISLISSISYANASYQIFGYIKSLFSISDIYEKHYVEPSDKIISSSNKTNNLIYIYLESYETTYTSIENGGNYPEDLISHSFQLANENISFSNDEKLGGFHSVNGSTWTMGALFTTTTGVPFAFPIEQNSMGTQEHFAQGITALGDILADYGYNQEFLCGSDVSFAGRDKFFKEHGNYKLFDLYSARENGYIPEDYFVYWGYEDLYLYEIAKDELLDLAALDQPFNFTMLTVDTHFPNGYICEKCEDKYPEIAANVVACADHQLNDFIKWCQEQDFYEDTTIIITGDHPRMDKVLVDGVDYYDRTIYNCFINPNVEDLDSIDTDNRTWTSLDMFPTTLAALGFDIKGERLGLGTNMFSNEKTLAEKLGYEYLQEELIKKSIYYITNFQ